MNEILTVAQCYESDRYAAAHGVPPLTLMENAGRAVAEKARALLKGSRVTVLCGPGNNGGDGFVAARILKERGFSVRVTLLGAREQLKDDAAGMAARWDGETVALSADAFADADLVIDALFGAGLSRPLEGEARRTIEALNCSGKTILAVDVPSGIAGDSGKVLGDVAIRADATVTFFRKKPAHVLLSGRVACGEIAVADIAIPDDALSEIKPSLFENAPALWGSAYRWPKMGGYKYSRGHCVVVSGPANQTGAARMAARGALRIGAGLVSVASPPGAVTVNASALTAIMVKPFAGARGLAQLLRDKRLNSVVIGPGCGVSAATRGLVHVTLARVGAAVLDADALTSFEKAPDELFKKLREPAVLTPHDGEFERIFPGLLKESPDKVSAVRAAAARAHCVVFLKGADTTVAAPDGRAAVNTNAPPTLATAGAGDVLSGFIGGLLAQGMQPFDAANAAVWLHGEAARRFGVGLIAEDLPEILPAVLRDLKASLENERSAHSRGTSG